MAMAFQRTRLLMRRSMARSPGIAQLVLRPDGIDVRCIQMDGQVRARGSRPLIELIQQIRCAIRTGCLDNLVQCLHPLRSLPWIRIHNPLVQCLVHGYFHYKG